MEPLDVVVALRMMLGRPPMSHAEPPKRFQETGGSGLRAVVCGERQIHFPAAVGQPGQHGLLDRTQIVVKAQHSAKAVNGCR